ncbi:MAG: PAS domain-containing protein [Chlorobi bacterium]|nr:PAS domain-containing protein [Chlorobiota bacterium]
MERIPLSQWDTIFKSMVDKIDEGILIVDANQKGMPIIFANKGFYKITGYEPNEVIGNNPKFLKGPETNNKAANMVRDCIRNKKNGSINVLNYKKDGTTFWNHFSISPIKDNLGNVTYWIGIQRDITKIVEIIESKSKKHSMTVTIHTMNDILNNFLNSLFFFRQHLEDCAGSDIKILDEFDDAYNNFKNEFIRLSNIEKFKEKKLGDDFSVLDLE